ncbi:MAG: hypothetical protein ACTHJ6_09525 [Oryzihumus sp.]
MDDQLVSTARPEPAPDARLYSIHRELMRDYDRAHTAGYLLIMNNHAGEPLADLIKMRDELAPRSVGALTIRQRGMYRGQVEALDILIDEKNGARRR